jgi:two-component system, sensor histidine kinase
VQDLLDRILAWHLDIAAFATLASVATVLLARYARRLHLKGTPLRAIVLVMVGASAVGMLAALRSDRHERDRMQAMIGGFAPTYALAAQQIGYETIGLDTAADDPIYLRLIEQQKELLRVNPHAHDIYTFHRLDDGKIVLVVDSETDYDRDGRYDDDREARTDIGEEYEPSDSGKLPIERCFAGEHTFDGEIYADRWGAWVSAYSPIRSADGRVLSVLGVDYDATMWLRAILGRRISTLSLFALMLTLVGGGTVLLLMHREHAVGEQLAKHNAELAAANTDLREANERALAASRAKTQFLANMSHELRTPLTAILGFTELLQEPDLDAASRDHHLATIHRSGAHLLTILSDILDLAKTEAGVIDLHPVPCALRTVCADVESLLRHLANGKDLRWSIEVDAAVPARIVIDPDRMRQILVNLCGNAIKFTERGGVTLRVRRDGAMLHFDVVDTGPGIAADQLPRLFQPFSQVDASATRRHGGTGLGLAISRRFATMLGGELTVTSVVGTGSTFRLALPCVEAPASEAEAGPAKPRKPIAQEPTVKLSGRVLLVEDGPDNQRLLTVLLRRTGLEVEVAANGRIALERLQQPAAAAFDLILMDMQMPEVDGYEATRRLRADGWRAPIIALTAHATVTDREQCLQAGCDDYLTKPIDRALLTNTIADWLRRAAAASTC